MVIIVGTFNVIDGLVVITNADQFENAFGASSELPVTNNVKTWGWVVLILGGPDPLGFLIFVGNMFGRVIGVRRALMQSSSSRSCRTTRSGRSP